MLVLRSYQERAVDGIRSCYRRRVRRVLLVMPCGSGKTVVFSKIAQGAAVKEKSVALIAHRKELITQCSDKLKKFGVEHGIIKAGFEPDYAHGIQVASVQTLQKRTDKIKPDMLIADEAHHSQSAQWQGVIAAFPDALLLGVTASPIFGNGKTLNGYYDEIVMGPTVRELIQDGYLVDTKVYAPPPVCDLSNVGSTAGDYNKSDLDDAMRKRSITGDAIDHYRRLAAGLQAICYTVTIKHAQEVAEQFREAGFSFYAIDGTMGDDERDGLLRDFAMKKINGLVSCDLISEGTDIPNAQVAIKLRPTMSFGLDIQQNGRINRPVYADGFDLETREGRIAAIAASPKPFAIDLDHVNNIHHHGMPDDVIVWSLTEKPRKATEGGTSVPVTQCSQCYLAFRSASPACPGCGFVREIQDRKPMYTAGELKEIQKADAAAEKEAEERQRLADRREEGMAKNFEDLLKIQENRGYKKGWAYHRAKSKGWFKK